MTDKKNFEGSKLRTGMIKAHRRRKNLCEICGRDVPEHTNIKECIENYQKADMRNEEIIQINSTDIDNSGDVVPVISNEKELAPNETYTPKPEVDSTSTRVKKVKKPFDVKTENNIINSKYIIVDVTPANEGYMIKYELIDYIRKKFKCVVYIIGDINKYPAYFRYQIAKRVGCSMKLIEKDKDVIKDHIYNSFKFYYLNSSEYKKFADDYSVYGDILISNGQDVGLNVVKKDPHIFE